MAHREGHNDLITNLKSEDTNSRDERAQPLLYKFLKLLSKTSDLPKLLQENPKPLIYPLEGFGLIWSAKSGSKALMFWFFCRVGLLDAARCYPEPDDPKVHQFRTQMIASDLYRQWLATCDPKTLKWLRVIRNPYNRAVSSFKQVLLGYEHLAEGLRLSIAEQGLSFAEFLDYLLVSDIANSDAHLRQQWHPIEDHVSLYRVINLDKVSLLPALDQFESQLGLTPVKSEAREDLLAEWKRDSSRYQKSLKGSNEDCSVVRFRRRRPSEHFPSYEAFLNPATRRKIERIYAKDFAAYADFL